MKKLCANIFFLIFILSPQLFTQQFPTGSPEWLVDMFFSAEEFSNKANYYTGEMLNYSNEPTIGEELSGEAEIFFHQIKVTENKIVFSVEVSNKNENIELYCYLIKIENNWKIDAVRRFLLPSFIYTVRDSLSHLNSLTMKDSTLLLSLQLFTASDYELKNYLRVKLNKFQGLLLAFINNLKDQSDSTLASVGCSAIYADGNYPGCIFIQILKFEDMEVGFIHAADSKLLPEISVEEFICVEEVVRGWFLYRIL